LPRRSSDGVAALGGESMVVVIVVWSIDQR
jgi:hypothetical protein